MKNEKDNNQDIKGPSSDENSRVKNSCLRVSSSILTSSYKISNHLENARLNN